MEERRELAEILSPVDGETNADAARRLVARVNELELAAVSAPPQQVWIAGPIPNAVIPASEIPDSDPNDPRPPFDPSLGWRTPEVEAWAERRRSMLYERRIGGDMVKTEIQA